MATPPPVEFTPPPIQTGWASESKVGPVPVWALWFQRIWTILSAAVVGLDTYITTTNITHTGTLTKSMSVTKVGRLVTVIVTYSDTLASQSTLGTTTFSLPYTPISKAIVTGINATTLVSLGNGYVSTDGNLYSPTELTGVNEVVVLTSTYFTS
jgi:hypothetical protein